MVPSANEARSTDTRFFAQANAAAAQRSKDAASRLLQVTQQNNDFFAQANAAAAQQSKEAQNRYLQFTQQPGQAY